MEHIQIPDEHVVPLDEIGPGVHGLRIVFVNVFSIVHADGSWTLIDAGLPFSENRIRKWAETEFGGRPNAIVLTHGHFDHVSAARALADEWRVPIFGHPLEFPHLTGQEEYPPPNTGAGGGLMSLLSPIYPRGPIDLGGRLRKLAAGSSEPTVLAELPGWQVLHTPGHTPGHVSFFQPEDGMLIVGDAFCSTKPESFFEAALAQQPELHGPPRYFTSDWDSARESVRRLAQLNPGTIAPGHGKPLSGAGIPEALRKLAANFDAISKPDGSRSAQKHSAGY
jgi:glyoxylase-like metal-dependent hydrolase (beta-lactamase superfamily II)